MLNKAIKIANRAHMGQVDKAFAPYILHPLRVMMSQENEMERICAVLHDVIEDSDVTLEDLRKEGFSEDILEVLDCVTKRAGENYDDFISRILRNKIACKIKLADLCDNMDISRIKNPTLKDKQRVEKYRLAAQRINDVLSQEGGPKEERCIQIEGSVIIQPYLSHDEFLDRFVSFVETQGWYFAGATEDVTDKK